MSSQDPNKPIYPDDKGGNGKKLSKKEFVEEYRLIPVEESAYDGDEEFIDVIGLLKDIWLNRNTVYLVMVVVFVLGLVVYAGSERIYYSEAKLMPETTSGTSQLNQVFQQAENIFGIQRRTEEEDIRVSMYPDIVASLPFQIELMQHEVYFSDIDQRISICEYFTEHYQQSFIEKASTALWDYTIGLPVTLFELFGRLFGEPPGERLPPDFSQLRDFNEPKMLDAQVRRVAQLVSGYITIEREPQTGFVSIGASLPDPYASTELVILTKNLLQEYVTDYRTEKALVDLEFIRERYNDAKQNYQVLQDSLAVFVDRNVNVARQSVAVQEQRLESEFQLAFNLYNTLARRMQEAEIQVQKETPVFRVHEPAVVPSRPAQPRASRIIGGSFFVGLFLGIAFIFLRRALIRFRDEFNRKEPKHYLA